MDGSPRRSARQTARGALCDARCDATALRASPRCARLENTGAENQGIRTMSTFILRSLRPTASESRTDERVQNLNRPATSAHTEVQVRARGVSQPPSPRCLSSSPRQASIPALQTGLRDALNLPEALERPEDAPKLRAAQKARSLFFSFRPGGLDEFARADGV